MQQYFSLEICNVVKTVVVFVVVQIIKIRL